jgi:hypothetical protein
MAQVIFPVRARVWWMELKFSPAFCIPNAPTKSLRQRPAQSHRLRAPCDSAARIAADTLMAI